MLRKKTGCLTIGITVLASDTDLDAETKVKTVGGTLYWGS